METKICGRCKEIKNINLFGLNKKTKSGYRSTCNDCRKLESKLYKEKNSEKRKETIKKYYNTNKEIIKKKTKIKYDEDPEKIKKLKLYSYHKNKNKPENIEKRKKYKIKTKKQKNEYQKNKIQTDLLYRLKTLIRSRITSFFKKNNFNKSNTTFDIVGCTPQFLKEHLEKQFTEGMNWDNYGFYGWHVDHIIPLSSAKTEDEIYKLCHYTNLQPLWAKDNLSKGKKIFF